MNTSLRLASGRRLDVAAAALVLAAWTGLAAWSLSPYAEWLDHARMDHIHAPPSVRLAVFALGWTLMIIAMMLPGTLLLLARCGWGEPGGLRRLVPLIVAYLLPWLAFGVFSYLGDSALHEVVEHNPAAAGLIAPAVLLLAGLYQFTPPKRACLARCRRVGAAWAAPGQASNPGGWALGLQHGLACLGSCWALMLLMFAFGAAGLLWMLAFAAVMTAERLARRASFFTVPLGVMLIFTAIVLAF